MAPILSYLVARANEGFVSGRYKIKDTTLIVSNGSGIWNGFPVRIGVPAEIVIITLE
jgi:predicted MPP superfamily phosphohydrolase